METKEKIVIRTVYFYLDKDWQVGASDTEPIEAEIYTIRDVSDTEYLKLANWNMSLAYSVIWNVKEKHIKQVKLNVKSILDYNDILVDRLLQKDLTPEVKKAIQVIADNYKLIINNS